MMISCTSTRPRKHEEGFVLIIVLWVVALLTVMTLSFAQRAVLEVKAAHYSLDHSRARMLARAAVHRGMLELQHKGINNYVEAFDNPDGLSSGTHLGQPWAERVDLLRSNIYFEESTRANRDDTVFYQIEDLAGRVDINRAPLELLSNIEQLEQNVRRQISGERSLRTQNSSSAVLYHDLEEIRYIRGMDDSAWFGKNGEPGVRDLFTVWGDSYSEGRINVNTAPLPVLAAIPGIGEEGARAILRFRGGEPITGTGGNKGFTSLAELAELLELSVDELRPFCMLSSTYFKIRGVATQQGGSVRASCTAVILLEQGRPLLKSWHEDLLGGQI